MNSVRYWKALIWLNMNLLYVLPFGRQGCMKRANAYYDKIINKSKW